MDIQIPDYVWGPTGVLLSVFGIVGGLLRYGARIAGWVNRAEEAYLPAKARVDDEGVLALERRMYFDRLEVEKRLDAMERTFATKEELAAVEARLSSSVGDLRGDVRDLGRYLAESSRQTNENLHRLIGDVAEIKGHLGKGQYKQEG